MSARLPLAVLSYMAPILSWAEASGDGEPPTHRRPDGSLAHDEQQRSWLLEELPTYSYDTADEILEIANTDWGRADQPARSLPLARWLRRWRSLAADDGARARMGLPDGYDLAYALLQGGRRYFAWHGSELHIRDHRLEELHELALRFPVTHLIRSRHAHAAVHGFLTEARALGLPERMSNLNVSSRSLRMVVERGLSEGHLHFGGVMSPYEGWADRLMVRSEKPSFQDLDPADERLFVLSRAVVRLLALVVIEGAIGHRRSWVLAAVLPWLDAVYFARSRAEELAARRGLDESLAAAARDLAERRPAADRQHKIGWLLRIVDPTSHLLWNWRHGATDQTEHVRGIRQRVQLLERLHFETQRLLVETSPLRSGTEPAPSLTIPGMDLEGYRTVLQETFFRYLVYQTRFWRRGIQSGRTTGLRNFRRFFGARQRKLLGKDSADIQGYTLERLRSSPHLHTVEGRIDPPRHGAQELLPWVVGYAEGIERRELDGFGLVIHFIKEAEREAPSRWAHRRLLYQGNRQRVARQARRLFRVLSQPHPVVPFIVGIDAANLELATPPEVFAPAFRFLREYPIECRRMASHMQYFGVIPEIRELLLNRRLGMTYHVGEEFRHLLSGLRAIAEVLEFLAPVPGDRLGHAVALGLDPDIWVEQTAGQAVVPKLEWLDTLVWVHHLVGPGDDLVGQLEIEDRIQRLAWDLYEPALEAEGSSAGRADSSPDLSPLTLYDAWRLRQLDPSYLELETLQREERCVFREDRGFDPEHRRWLYVQRRVADGVGGKIGSKTAYRLLHAYWLDPGVARRGREPEIVEMKGGRKRRLWLELCRRVQDRLQREVLERQLVVETNLSSNRVVGPMSQFREHPIFSLTLDGEGRQKRQVRVTVNTDDPGVFNTSLAHEYYLLGEIQMEKGVPETEVVEWLEWLRSNGNDYSFVRSLPTAEDPRVVKLLESLRDTLPMLRERLSGSGRWGRFWGRFTTEARRREERNQR